MVGGRVRRSTRPARPRPRLLLRHEWCAGEFHARESAGVPAVPQGLKFGTYNAMAREFAQFYWVLLRANVGERSGKSVVFGDPSAIFHLRGRRCSERFEPCPAARLTRRSISSWQPQRQ
jgi:hypothetical protein